MDEKQHTKAFFRERRIGKIVLYFELVYVLVLASSVILSFSLFTHLLVFQFILAGVYFVSGIIYVRYLAAKGRLPKDESKAKKEPFLNKFLELSAGLDSKFFYHSLELVTVILGAVAGGWLMSYTYLELFLDARNFDILHTVIGYLGFGLGLLVYVNIFGLLIGKRDLVGKSAAAEIVLTVMMLVIYPVHWVNLLLVFLVAVSAEFLFIKNKI